MIRLRLLQSLPHCAQRTNDVVLPALDGCIRSADIVLRDIDSALSPDPYGK